MATDTRRIATAHGMRCTGQAGFTLIELLMVVSIIAVLSGVVVFAVGNAKRNAAQNACQTERVTFETASNASQVDPGDNIRSYLKTDQGIYFEVQGSTGFSAIAGSGFTAGCVPI